MAVKHTNDNRDFEVEEYIIDSEDDLPLLPTEDIGWGSMALCISNGLVYVLNSSYEWVELGNN